MFYKYFLLLLLFYFANSTNVYAQCGRYIVDSDGNNFITEQLDSIVGEYNVFFTAETHARKGNTEIAEWMIRYLYEKASLRKLIVELPVSNENFINAYILRGNIDSLKILEKAQGFSRDFKKWVEFLYCFNKSKSSENKISIAAIDAEYTFITALKVLVGFLPNKTPPVEITENIEHLKKYNSTFSKKSKDIYQTFFDELCVKMEQNPTPYKNYLGDHYSDFKKIVMSTSIGNSSSLFIDFIHVITPESKIADSLFLVKREEFLYNNYLEVLNKYPKQTFYGQFGKVHTILKKTDDHYASGFCSLACKLNNKEDSPAYQKVCSLNIIYNPSDLNNGRNTKEEAWNLYKKLLLNVGKGNLVLYKTKELGRDFEELSEKFQYVILVK